MTFRPLNLDSKREEYRKYLEKAGALDALSKVLVMLYDEPEKPADALEYIRKHLGDSNRPDEAELNVLKSDLEESRLKIQALEDEVKVLKERLAKYEPVEETVAMDEQSEGGAGASAGAGAATPATATVVEDAPAPAPAPDAEATPAAEEDEASAQPPAEAVTSTQ